LLAIQATLGRAAGRRFSGILCLFRPFNRCQPVPHIPHPELCDLCCIYL